jgi:hypothetical protein
MGGGAFQFGWLCRNCRWSGRQCRGPRCGALQEISAIDNGLGLLSHEFAPRIRGYFSFISHELSRLPHHMAADFNMNQCRLPLGLHCVQ